MLLVRLPPKLNSGVASPLVAEALAVGQLEVPLAEVLSHLSDRFLRRVLGGEGAGVRDKGALLTLAVSRAACEQGGDQIEARRSDLLRWCRCMCFLLHLERLRRAGSVRSIRAEPITDPNAVTIFA